jgi:hypothetical protein
MNAPLLTDADKLRLEQEERLRSEIRTELEPKDTKKKKKGFPETLWEALNSSIGIWFLSAVLVSGLGKLYTDKQNDVQEEVRKRQAQLLEKQRARELNDRLTLEISFRFSSTMSRLRRADVAFGESRTPDSRKAIVDAVSPLAFPASDSYPPLFPEFKSFSGLALIAELRRHADTGEKLRLKEILAGTSALMYDVLGETQKVERTPRKVASLLLERMK